MSKTTMIEDLLRESGKDLDFLLNTISNTTIALSATRVIGLKADWDKDKARTIYNLLHLYMHARGQSSAKLDSLTDQEEKDLEHSLISELFLTACVDCVVDKLIKSPVNG